VLGQLWPEAIDVVLPRATVPALKVIAQLGVILYMFVVGLELNAELLAARARLTLAIAHASMVVPFLLGAALALWLFTEYAPAGISFTNFALFLGVALAITALPVLARILTDRRLEKTPLGVLALGCAAAGDVTAWCLLALVVGIARAEVGTALATAILSLVYLAIMFLVVAPLARSRLGQLPEARLTAGVAAWVLVAVLVSAWATEAIGVHALFGAFLLGAVIPHDSAVARLFTHKLEDVVMILLLPVFFAYTGLNTRLGLVSRPEDWLVCGVIILAATAGKFGGTLAAARASGLNQQTATALGVLMNTRGLMELIVLNLGLEMGVISPTLFAMLVLLGTAWKMNPFPSWGL
jgi:Kef-type K+ transport system membrane component KefB